MSEWQPTPPEQPGHEHQPTQGHQPDPWSRPTQDFQGYQGYPTQQQGYPGYGSYHGYPGYQPGQGYPGYPGYPAAPPRRPGVRPGVVVATLAAFALLFVVAAAGIAFGLRNVNHQSPGTTSTNRPGGVAIPAPTATSGPGGTVDPEAIAQKVDAAVVDVDTVLGYQNARAAGTGIVIKSSGVVLTNNHVVAGATSITVTEVSDGRTFTATVVGYDRSEDIAVLQMAGASGLPTATLANSSTVAVGDPIVAIGNAGGTGGTPTTVSGQVTALNQSITASDEGSGASEQLTGLIQVAADIQAGDSGGPLVNKNAQVIGIDTAATAGFRYRASGGQGFAIPINSAVSIANQILGNQASDKIHLGQTAFLGVDVTSVGADSNGSGGSGAGITGVEAGSPAESAGLGSGDVIVSVDGQPVDSPTTLTTLLDRHHPGDRVTIGWTDSSGQSQSAAVSLASGPVG
jgi:S1-C subfamily serine protease